MSISQKFDGDLENNVAKAPVKYQKESFHWEWGNHTVDPMHVNPTWRKWVIVSYESSDNW